MENRQDIHVKNIAKYAQVLLSDGLLVLSTDKNISTVERKNLVYGYIKLIRNSLDAFEKEVNLIK